jgi:hypothetical protein
VVNDLAAVPASGTVRAFQGHAAHGLGRGRKLARQVSNLLNEGSALSSGERNSRQLGPSDGIFEGVVGWIHAHK